MAVETKSLNEDSAPQESSRPASSWVVVFAGARDSYQVPLALHEAGALKTLVTDFYSPLDQPFARAVSRFLPSSWQTKLGQRFCAELPSRLVSTYPRFALTNWRRPMDWPSNAAILGEVAGGLADRKDCGILAYSHVATAAFSHSAQSPKVLFQMQPHPTSMRRALLADPLKSKLAGDSYDELAWPSSLLETYSREPLLADLCIAASNYTRETLIENGVASERIAVIPYGVDLDFFMPAAHEKDSSRETFTVLFVGQSAQYKGLHHLLEAWRRLQLPKSELRVRTDIGPSSALSDNPQTTFLRRIDRNILREEYRSCDLLVLPSLGEGFGLVLLEAMACGTPALATTSCGGPDLIRHGENGFLIPAGDLDALADSLSWASRNRESLRQMRPRARNTAEQYPWKRFRHELVRVLRDL